MQQEILAGLSVKKSLFMHDWEGCFDWPLDEVAKDIGIKRGSGKAWDWTTQSASG